LSTTYTQVSNQSNATVVQNASSGANYGTTFTYTTDYSGGQAAGQVVNAVVDSSGTIINYSTNAVQGQGIIQQRVIGGGQIQRGIQQMGKPAPKPMKDPNAPKKPLSAYFLYSQEERLKVKAEFPDFSITEIAKELGRRWASLDPGLKQSYEDRYHDSRKEYESALTAYKPQKKKKDPNAPKQPLSAYFLFSQEERDKVKLENPSYSICEVAKELGKRWAEMAPEVKQRYQQMAEDARQKYDQEMASYRQAGFSQGGAEGSAASQSGTTFTVSTDYGNLL
jgi:ABC-type transporter MlaC component